MAHRPTLTVDVLRALLRGGRWEIAAGGRATEALVTLHNDLVRALLEATDGKP